MEICEEGLYSDKHSFKENLLLAAYRFVLYPFALSYFQISL